MTIRSYRNFSDCYPPCWMHISHLLLADLQIAAHSFIGCCFICPWIFFVNLGSALWIIRNYLQNSTCLSNSSSFKAWTKWDLCGLIPTHLRYSALWRTNRPWVLGILIYEVKLERVNWFEPVHNIHKSLSPTVTPVFFFICPSSTQEPKNYS